MPSFKGQTVGDPIPGSVYFRGFCSGCGEPIRVSKALVHCCRCNSCVGASNKRPVKISRGCDKHAKNDISFFNYAKTAVDQYPAASFELVPILI